MNSSRIRIALSCLVGLAVGALYLARISAVRQEIGAFQEAVEVVAAATPLEIGDRLLQDRLTVLGIPRPYLPRRAILSGDMEKVVARSLIHPVPAGDPILWTDLPEGPRVHYPSEAIPSGYRALALPADDIRTLSHLLVPGDRVDVVWTGFRDQSDVPSSEILCGNVPVLALGRQMSPEGTDGQEDAIPDSTTLLLRPSEALEILTAGQSGIVTLLARGREGGDRSPEKPEAVSREESGFGGGSP
ncbi:MAG: Flp pilus assembly protein CpaB [bacterium]|nr:MAG: Flp pilus assembly protein CpaB [bacterium]